MTFIQYAKERIKDIDIDDFMTNKKYNDYRMIMRIEYLNYLKREMK